MSSFFLLILVLLGYAGEVHADILFLDLNNGEKEIEAARAAADKRWTVGDDGKMHREKLIVFPDVPTSVRRRFREINSQLDALAAGIDKTGFFTAEIQDKMSRLNQEEESLKGKYFVTSALLGTKLKELAKKHVKLTSLVISGHSSGDEFYGQFADKTFGRDDILNALESAPEIRNSIHSIFLWGCYGGTESNSLYWKNSDSKLNLVVGFSATAPLSTQSPSYYLLGDALIRAEELAGKNDLRSVRKMLLSLNSVNQTPATLLVGKCFVGTEVPSTYEDGKEANC